MGTELEIHIPIRKPELVFSGEVAWCSETSDGKYEIGVEFADEHLEYRVRLIEQICYMEHYRKKILEEEDRKLSGTEAAEEWANKFAKDFPE